MPYRRLPNTDRARIKALKKALAMGKDKLPSELAFSQKCLAQVQSFLPKLEQAIIMHHQSYMLQVKENKLFIEKFKVAQTYLSHFIQVLNFTIIRNELPEKARLLYGFEEKSKRLPNISTEEGLLKWGKSVIDGEAKRISTGGAPILNPKIAMVKIKYQHFEETLRYQKKLQEITNIAQEKVADMREQADILIQRIWNEVEASHDFQHAETKRKRSEEYGVVYVFRKNERKRFNLSIG